MSDDRPRNVGPRNLEAEACVIGAILLDQNSKMFDRVRSIVRAEDFFDLTHRTFFEVFERLSDRGVDFDPVVVKAYLGKKIAEPEKKIVELFDTVPSSAHAEDYATVVRDLADRRRLAGTLTELHELPAALDVETPTSSAVERLLDAEAEAFEPEKKTTFADDVQAAVASYDRPAMRLPWGLPGLDAIMSGTPPGSVNILAARPGGGKTTFALEVTRAVARAGKRVDFIGLEMGRDELLPIMLCAEAKIDNDSWTRRTVKDFEMSRVIDAANLLHGLPVHLHDPDSMSLSAFRSIAFRRAALGSNLIVLDYVQLLEGDENLPRYEQFAQMTRTIKKTARRIARRGYDCRFLVLAQMNREIEKAKRRKPQLSDLRESGTLEQDADAVLFIHPIPNDAARPHAPIDVEVIVAKHRSGRTGTAMFRWDKGCRFYTDLLGSSRPAAPASPSSPPIDDATENEF